MEPGPSADPEFRELYSTISQLVVDRLRTVRTDDDVLAIEPVESAQYCLVEVPEDVLLEIDDDLDFVIACYAKLLDRMPSLSDASGQALRIQRRGVTRQEFSRLLLGSLEYERKGVRVNLVRSR